MRCAVVQRRNLNWIPRAAWPSRSCSCRCVRRSTDLRRTTPPSGQNSDVSGEAIPEQKRELRLMGRLKMMGRLKTDRFWVAGPEEPTFVQMSSSLADRPAVERDHTAFPLTALALGIAFMHSLGGRLRRAWLFVCTRCGMGIRSCALIVGAYQGG